MGTVWKALADDSRRQVLLMLIDGEKSPSEMAAKFKFTMPALSTHLRILRDAGLIVERREGQRRLYSLNANGMNELFEFVDVILGISAAQPEALLQGQGEPQGLNWLSGIQERINYISLYRIISRGFGRRSLG